MDDNMWFVLRTKPNRDFRAIERLRQHHPDAFAPSEVKFRRRGRVRQRVPMRYSLIPGYVVLGTYGPPRWPDICGLDEVVGPVSFDGTPARLDPSAVTQLRMMETTETTIQLHKGFKAGDTVKIDGGPFGGHIAPVIEIRNGRAMIRLPLLGSEQTISIPVEYLDAA